MNFKLCTAAAVMCAASLVVSSAYAASDGDGAAKKHHATRKEQTPPPPSVEEQINALRSELQGQINQLKSDLDTKDAELKQAQQQATDAQAAAAKAQQAADAQAAALSDNTAAVSTLQSSVKDINANTASLASSISDTQTTIKKAIENPDVIHYKGITLSPAGSFLAGETVYRSSAIGYGLNTHFTSVPLQNADNANISEWQGSGRQSRVALKATGKLDNFTMSGYYEADWLSAGATSNNNQSNSYTMRQRQLWADAKTTSGWDFSGGQGWSLAAETTQGLTRGTEILPATIDPQYEAGFVWTRQYSFRVSKDFGKSAFLGISAENAETLNPAGSNLPTNYLFAVPGDSGGLYNSANNYSFNSAPDFVIKMAFEPGWGHWEIFNIDRFFRNRIYPGETCTTSSTGTTTCSGTAGAYDNTVTGSGIGAGFRGPLFDKKLTIGLKGLYGEGVGRYGSSTIADVTVRPDGSFAPLRAFSALSTLEMNPTKRLMLYFNYGGDYVYREYWLSAKGGKAIGYGIPGYISGSPSMSGCGIEVVPSSTTGASNPSSCGAQNKDVQEVTAGYWYNIYSGPKGRLRYGMQYSWFERDLWSGNGGTANPGGGGHGNDNEIYTSFRYYLP
ncbi:MAG: hypothetical protein WBE41_22390 [Terracidiphilus sp.]